MGDLKTAVEVSIKIGEYADALVIASAGDADLFKSARNKYLDSSKDSFRTTLKTQLFRPSAMINGELARIEEVCFDGSYILWSLVPTQRLVDPKNGKSGISSWARKMARLRGESLKESSTDCVVNINNKLVKRKRMIGFQNMGNELVILNFFRPEDSLMLWPLSSGILKPKEVCYWNPDPENPREPEYLCQLTRPSQDSEDPLESVVLKREASFQVYDHQSASNGLLVSHRNP